MKTKVESWIQKIKSWVALLPIVLKLFVYGCEEKIRKIPLPPTSIGREIKRSRTI